MNWNDGLMLLASRIVRLAGFERSAGPGLELSRFPRAQGETRLFRFQALGEKGQQGYKTMECEEFMPRQFYTFASAYCTEALQKPLLAKNLGGLREAQ